MSQAVITTEMLQTCFNKFADKDAQIRLFAFDQQFNDWYVGVKPNHTVQEMNVVRQSIIDALTANNYALYYQLIQASKI